jgi:hypothetical protein
LLIAFIIAYVTLSNRAECRNINLIKIKCLIRSLIAAKVTARSTKVHAKFMQRSPEPELIDCGYASLKMTFEKLRTNHDLQETSNKP